MRRKWFACIVFILLPICTYSQLGSRSVHLEEYIDVESDFKYLNDLSQLCHANDIESYQEAAPQDFLDMMQMQCYKSLCIPSCLNQAWGVAIQAKEASCSSWPQCKSFVRQVQSAQVQAAINAQFKARACSSPKFIGACDPDSPHLVSWIESQSFGEENVAPVIPLQSCQSGGNADKAKEACAACKAAVAVMLYDIPCKQVNVPSNMDGQPADPSTWVNFQNAGLDPKGTLPKHKSNRDKCIVIKKKAISAKGNMMGEFSNERVCACLGCCVAGGSLPADPTCYFPLTYNLNSAIGRYTG